MVTLGPDNDPAAAPLLFQLADAHVKACASGTGEESLFDLLWPQFRAALHREKSEVRGAYFGSRRPVAVVEMRDKANRRLLGPFEWLAHGDVYPRSVLVMTGNGDAQLAGLLFNFARLYILASRHTDAEDADVGYRLARMGMYDCASALDQEGADPLWLGKKVAALEQQKDEVEQYYLKAAQRHTMGQYIIGMVGGLVLVPVIALGVIWVWNRWSLHVVGATGGELNSMRDLALVGLIWGGLGAVVSVLLRTNSAQSCVDPESSRHHLIVSPAFYRGAFRVLLGSIFGSIIVWVFRAGLITVTIQPKKGSDVAVVGTLAFLSGFSERWARDTVLRVVQPTGGSDRYGGGGDVGGKSRGGPV